MQVSVVVPTYKREDLLKRCLEKLAMQNFDPEEYEILIIDDGPSDATRKLVEDFSRESKRAVRYLTAPSTQGPAGARNIGWRAARGNVIAFTDDDCQPDSDWLSEGIRVMTSEQADAVTGQTVVPLPDEPTDSQRDTAGLAAAEFITANCFCRRGALEAVGGFDERFTRAWREDSDLQFNLLERGMKIVRAEKAVVVHPARPMPWGISLKQQRKGVFDPLLYRKHQKLYRRSIAPLPRFYYAALASLIVAIGGMIGQSTVISLGGICVWLLLTGWFALQRLKRASLRPSHVAEMVVTSSLIPFLSIYWRIRGAWRYRVFQL